MNFHTRTILSLILCLVFTVTCTTKEITWAPDMDVAAAAYKNNQPSSVTLLTMINNTTGTGGHSALIINSSERILFDPAGTFKHPQIPERHDVYFGINEQALERYIDFHARPTIHVVMQRVKIDPETALELSKTVKNYGPVQDMMCSYAISEILHSLKGFETISKSYFPKIMMQNFSKIEGITTYRVYDYFEDDKPNIFLENQQPKK